MSQTSNNKRIAKNTLILYFRMFLVMLVSLYTSRIVLETLGVSDFGIYNVVAGVVIMMNVINGALSVSTQRYLTYEVGKNDKVQFQKTFSISLNIFFALSILILIVGETLGLWFVNTYLVIPEDRIAAANWVYQFSLLSCIFSLLYNPYNATIISHEKMDIYAYIGIMEVILKLIIVYLLLVIPYERLATYGFLTCLSTLITLIVYYVYTKQNYPETKYIKYWDKKLFKQLLAYSFWNLFGSLSGIAKGQGLNILINIFFGPSVNASRGIAYQVNGVVQSFFSNFYTAVRPQITKYYAQGDLPNMHKLVYNSSKLSFILILIVSLPLVIETPFVINLWLGQMPDYIVPFIRLIIMITAIESMSTPLMTAIHATGKNKNYQISVGIIMIMTLPVSYIFLRLGFSPISVFVVSLFLSLVSLFVRLYIAGKQTHLSFSYYTKYVILRCFIVAVVACLLPIFLYKTIDENWSNSVFIIITSIFSCVLSAYFIGLTSTERNSIKQIIKRKILKK